MTDLMTDATITFYGVAKSFGPTMALSDVSFAAPGRWPLWGRAPAGRITAFVGRNGADKSTALRILLGMATPDAGTAVIGGKAAEQLPVATVGALVGAEAHPGTTVLDHLMIRGQPPSSGRGDFLK